MPSNPTYIFEDLEAGGTLNSVIPNPSIIEIEVPTIQQAGGSGGGSGTVTSVAGVEPVGGDVERADLVAELNGTASTDLAPGNTPPIVVSNLVADADLSGGGFTTLDLVGVASGVARALLVGGKVAAVSGGSLGTVYTITASGPCTAGETIGPGRVVSAFGSGLRATALSTNGTTVTGLKVGTTDDDLDALSADTTNALDTKADASDVAAHEAALLNIAGAAQSPFAAWLHNGDTNDDGVTEWLDDIEYTGLTGKAGTPYAGIPLHRPAAATISGVTPPSDFTGVIYLTGQDTADHDGAHELFHTLESVGYVQADVDPGGTLRTTYGITDLDIGLFTTQTQTWNWGWIDPTDPRIVDDVEPIGLEVLQAGSLFRVGGGDNAGLWSTTVDGIHGPAVPAAEKVTVIYDGAANNVSDVLEAQRTDTAALDSRVDTLEGEVYRSIKTNTTSKTNDTLAADSGLSIASVPASDYKVRAFIRATSGSSTPDIKATITGGTIAVSGFGVGTGASAVPADMQFIGHTTGTALAAGVVGNSGGVLVLEGLITVASTATVAVEWAQDATNATSTDVLPGSSLVLEKV